jgi:alkanesulfonate monooxygenase SsuD/methylene tetrahydromethanopterin reductase-like flavin-dependent oxidoreductase (luciferase family)
LTVTGRLADGWIPSLGYAPPEKLGEMRDKVLAAATDAGRDEDDITCILNVEVRIDESGTAVGDAVTGPPSRVVHQLAHYTALGFNGFNFIPVGPDLDEQRARLALEVIPALRQTTDESAAPAES